MNVAFEAMYLLGYTGMNVYTRSLVSHLADTFADDRYTLLTTYNKVEKISAYFSEVDRARVTFANPLPHPLALGRAGLPLTETIIHQKFRRLARGFDVMHFPDPYHFVSRIPNSVVTVHDIIPLYPHLQIEPATRHRYRRRLNNIAKHANTVFVPSEFVRTDLLTETDIKPERVIVTYEAAGPEFKVMEVSDSELHTLGIPENKDYFLFVGRIDIRKNIDRLVAAYKRLPHELTDRIRLVLIANGSPKDDARFQKEILGHPHIHHLRNVPNAGLVKLLNRAYALTFVSLNEGFGIPLLEAMQCGCPIITSNVSSMPEVAGDAAEYIDPYSIDDIERALLRVAEEPTHREQLRQRGIRRALDFSWTKCAMQTHEGYKAALGH